MTNIEKILLQERIAAASAVAVAERHYQDYGHQQAEEIEGFYLSNLQHAQSRLSLVTEALFEYKEHQKEVERIRNLPLHPLTEENQKDIKKHLFEVKQRKAAAFDADSRQTAATLPGNISHDDSPGALTFYKDKAFEYFNSMTEWRRLASEQSQMLATCLEVVGLPYEEDIKISKELSRHCPNGRFCISAHRKGMPNAQFITHNAELTDDLDEAARYKEYDGAMEDIIRLKSGLLGELSNYAELHFAIFKRPPNQGE